LIRIFYRLKNLSKREGWDSHTHQIGWKGPWLPPEWYADLKKVMDCWQRLTVMILI